MATGTYVRLTKEQESSLQNITPGELNQPIDVQKVPYISPFLVFISSIFLLIPLFIIHCNIYACIIDYI